MMSNRLTIWLMVLCGLLLIGIFWPYELVSGTSTTEKTLPEVQNIEEVSAKSVLPVSAYVAIAQQPLFSPSRRIILTPVIQQTTVKASAAEKTQRVTETALPKLVGVMTIEGQQTAFVMAERAQEPIMVSVGEEIQGWSVVSISGTEAVVEQNDKRETLLLDWGSSLSFDAMTQQSQKSPNPRTGVTQQARTQTVRLRDRLARQIAGEDYDID